MQPLKDMLGEVLRVGQQVAYAVITHKRAHLRVGTIDRVDPQGEVLVKPIGEGQRSTWKQPRNVVGILVA